MARKSIEQADPNTAQARALHAFEEAQAELDAANAKMDKDFDLSRDFANDKQRAQFRQRNAELGALQAKVFGFWDQYRRISKQTFTADAERVKELLHDSLKTNDEEIMFAEENGLKSWQAHERAVKQIIERLKEAGILVQEYAFPDASLCTDCRTALGL